MDLLQVFTVTIPVRILPLLLRDNDVAKVETIDSIKRLHETKVIIATRVLSYKSHVKCKN